VAERISGQEWHILLAFSVRVDGALEARLQATLPSATGHILRGARRTNPVEYDGPADACRDHFGTYREYARQREILLPHNRPCPQTNSVIKRVNTIGQRERQGRDFRSLNLNRRKEPYEWTDTVPEDDADFQGLLEEPAPYPDLSSDLPGVALEDENVDLQVVTDEPEPDFAELAAAALDNAGLNAGECIQAAQRKANERMQAAAQCANLDPGPTLIEANNNKIVYEITFDMPDDGLLADNVVPTIPCMFLLTKPLIS